MAEPIQNPNSCCHVGFGCCPNGLPTTLVATITNAIGSNCDCADEATVSLEWDGRTGPGTAWDSDGNDDFGMCGRKIRISVVCVADAFCAFHLHVDVINCAEGISIPVPDDCDCDPINILYSDIDVTGCCGGMPPETINITITE